MSDIFSCWVCEGSGIMQALYDDEEWKPEYDRISGYYGFEYRSKKTGKLVLAKDLVPVDKICCNCDGAGILRYEELVDD